MKISTFLTGATGNDDGFTVLEALVVICIVGIVSSASVFALKGLLDRSEVEAASAVVERELLLLSDAARRTGRDRIAQIRSYPETTQFIFESRIIELRKPIAAKWVAAVESAQSQDGGAVVFFGSGGASGGTIRLSDGPSEAIIIVDWLSGKVRLQGRDQ